MPGWALADEVEPAAERWTTGSGLEGGGFDSKAAWTELALRGGDRIRAPLARYEGLAPLTPWRTSRESDSAGSDPLIVAGRNDAGLVMPNAPSTAFAADLDDAGESGCET